jgi:hypothetical protein
MMTSRNQRCNAPISTHSRDLERKKLLNKESDWKLPGTSTPVTTRTRSNGTGRPTYIHRKKLFIEPLSSEPEEQEDSEEESIGSDEEFDEELLLAEDDLIAERLVTKPKPTRVIVEVDELWETLEKHCRCPTCNGEMEVEVETLCVSSTVGLKCKKKSCGYVHYSGAVGGMH